MNLRSLGRLIRGVLLLGVASCLQAQILYTVTDLGEGTVANGINNRGQVVGSSNYIAFIYSQGQMKMLGTLPGYHLSVATGINDAGEVAGYAAYNNVDQEAVEAFLYSNGQLTDLGLSGEARAINNAGQVTGAVRPNNLDELAHAFLYSNGQITWLGTLPGYQASLGNGINNAGQVVGYAVSGAGRPEAFIYSNGEMTDLGNLGTSCFEGGLGCFSQGYGINDKGEATGTSITGSDPVRYHAFLYSNGQMRDLNTFPGYEATLGRAINNAGDVVGSSAFLYSNNEMRNLNNLIDPALGIILFDARGINEHGQIVANGRLQSEPSYARHGYLLTPICAAPVISDVSATPNVLWPPNYGLVQVNIGYTVDDACPGTCELTVSSNEPVKGKADDKRYADWRVVDGHQVQLRARRDGNENGRVYTITITCVSNTNGQSSTKTVEVLVPHDQGQ